LADGNKVARAIIGRDEMRRLGGVESEKSKRNVFEKVGGKGLTIRVIGSGERI
jgi:hypothetical protein